MRTIAAALLVLVLGACSSGGGDGEADGQTTDAPPSSVPDGTEAPDDPLADLSDTEACAEVRAGIDAFNLGDVDETVARFEAAIPLAEQLVADAAAPGTDLLLEAIRYYAALPAEEYGAASPSPEFQRYKTVTLTQCDYGSTPSDSDTGLEA